MIVRQTWEQALLKHELFRAFRGLTSFTVRFHWRFWKPLDAIGGKVYFGRYVEYDDEEFHE